MKQLNAFYCIEAASVNKNLPVEKVRATFKKQGKNGACKPFACSV
jgi:hypothetical protein